MDIIFLDFSKAFYCASHQLLIHKLKHLFGISNDLLLWLQDYQSQRTQLVIVEGYNSREISDLSGVLQGSILGPLMFLLYINEMSLSEQHSTIALMTPGILSPFILRTIVFYSRMTLILCSVGAKLGKCALTRRDVKF